MTSRTLGRVRVLTAAAAGLAAACPSGNLQRAHHPLRHPAHDWGHVRAAPRRSERERGTDHGRVEL